MSLLYTLYVSLFVCCSINCGNGSSKVKDRDIYQQDADKKAQAKNRAKLEAEKMRHLNSKEPSK